MQWGFLSGANTRIRTGDLILTKDVLYQLSHISILFWLNKFSFIIIAEMKLHVKGFGRIFSVVPAKNSLFLENALKKEERASPFRFNYISLR